MEEVITETNVLAVGSSVNDKLLGKVWKLKSLKSYLLFCQGSMNFQYQSLAEKLRAPALYLITSPDCVRNGADSFSRETGKGLNCQNYIHNIQIHTHIHTHTNPAAPIVLYEFIDKFILLLI